MICLTGFWRKRLPAVPRCSGFTLLELLVVVAIIALATTGVSFALRDSQTAALDREAARLMAMLETGRAQSRTTGAVVRWVPDASGFRFEGVSARGLSTESLAGPRQWLNPDMTATVTQPTGERSLVLGPEPLVPPQAVTLRLGNRALVLATDGLSPFSLRDEATP